MRSLALNLLLCGSAAAQTPGFWLVGTAPGSANSIALALSQDGTIASGFSTQTGHYVYPGFTWTSTGGRNDFGLEPGMPDGSAAYGVSSDGHTVVGFMGGPGPNRAYRRIGTGPLQDLGPLLSYQRTRASGVSGDGNAVVGHGESTINGVTFGQAFRWTSQGGMQPLGWLHGSGAISDAHAISRDGNTVVGESGASVSEAFVWRQNTGIQGLPPLLGSTTLSSHARGVNADGSVIVGDAVALDGNHHAVAWTTGGAQDIGDLPGYLNSYAFAASDNGSVIAGGADGLGFSSAFVWTPSAGMQAFPDYLTLFGVSVPGGWTPRYIYAVSGDGLTFAGEAVSSTGAIQGFVATVPAPTGAVVVAFPALLVVRRRRWPGPT